jgi:hypothetical protein
MDMLNYFSFVIVLLFCFSCADVEDNKEFNKYIKETYIDNNPYNSVEENTTSIPNCYKEEKINKYICYKEDYSDKSDLPRPADKLNKIVRINVK